MNSTKIKNTRANIRELVTTDGKSLITQADVANHIHEFYTTPYTNDSRVKNNQAAGDGYLLSVPMMIICTQNKELTTPHLYDEDT